MYKLIIISLFLLFQSTFILANDIDKKPAFILASGNLKFVFPQMLKNFYEANPKASVLIQYGASGDLADTIVKGKSYDIFFSANLEYAQEVYKVKRSTTIPKKYTQGILILFVPANTSLSEQKIDILNSKEIKNITISNKSNSPYGVAAIETINNSKCCTKVKNKIRYSSDVATAIDNVIWQGDAGFLSKSALYMIPDDRKKKGIDWLEIDQKLYTPIIQAYVVSEHGLNNLNAINFINFIESEVGQKIFRNNGYININSH